MTSSIFSALGFGGQRPQAKANAIRALPASWYTSPEMYDLEKRAIFTRRWLMITHSGRLEKPGDWLKYDVVNIDFVLYRGEDGEIHGARDVSQLDHITDNHYGIHIHIDHNGFIWVNLDEKAVPEVAWDDLFQGIDQQDRYEGLDFDNYVFDHSWQMEANYNWKMASDNYNECYHCATTHPDLVGLTNLEAYYVEPAHGWIKHFVATKPEQEAKGLRVHPTYFYPSTSMNISLNFFMLQRFIPHGPTKSVMYYEVYRNKNAADEDFQLINEMYHRVMSEDKALCNLAQNNVNQGLFINGEMHPRLEAGPLHIQQLCRKDVMAVHARDVAAKHRSWSIPQTVRDMSSYAFGGLIPKLEHTPLRALVAA